MSQTFTPRSTFRRFTLGVTFLALTLMLVQSAMASSDNKVDAAKQGIVQPAAVTYTYASLVTGSVTSPGLAVIHVGNDMAFGVIHRSVGNNWGGVNQFYPPDLHSPADFGILVRRDSAATSILYAPDFGDHGSTATGNLGAHRSWTGTSNTGWSGLGTSGSPYTLTTTGSAGPLTLAMTTTYVKENDFFTQDLKFTNTSASTATFDVFLAGDHYTAGSDFGIPIFAGGRQCIPGGDLQVFHGTSTAPTHQTSTYYSSVWSQIASPGHLNDTVDITTPACKDNGSALEWHVILGASANTTIASKTTFNQLPPYVPSLTTWGIMLLTALLASFGLVALVKRKGGVTA